MNNYFGPVFFAPLAQKTPVQNKISSPPKAAGHAE
jgi:hypothetical protein